MHADTCGGLGTSPYYAVSRVILYKNHDDGAHAERSPLAAACDYGDGDGDVAGRSLANSDGSMLVGGTPSTRLEEDTKTGTCLEAQI